jgi:hypothetical protein
MKLDLCTNNQSVLDLRGNIDQLREKGVTTQRWPTHPGRIDNVCVCEGGLKAYIFEKKHLHIRIDVFMEVTLFTGLRNNEEALVELEAFLIHQHVWIVQYLKQYDLQDALHATSSI